MSRLLRGKEGERFCIAPHRASHFKLGRTLQSWEKVTCVAPSPFGEEHWKTKSIKRPFVLDYCSTLRSRSFHLLTQINIHFAPCYSGVPSLRSVSLRKIRFVQFGFIDFRPQSVILSPVPVICGAGEESINASYKAPFGIDPESSSG